MNIAIDVLHISYWNFYKNIIDLLEKQNHVVYIFVRERGPLLKVIRKEYRNQSRVIVTGKYYKGKKKLVLHLLRIPVLIFYLVKYKIDVVSSDGFFIAAASRLLKIPAVLHSDDFEYKMSYKMSQFFSSTMVIPDAFPITSKKDITYRGCKEYAYLNRKYFQPEIAHIESLIPNINNYGFIRLVSNSSLNYLNKNDSWPLIQEVLSYCKEKKITILLSSEDEISVNYDNCILLTPPIKDYHSILKYAKFILSEGDTMAREAAVLNTPCIYIGQRKMKVHSYFQKTDQFLETNEINAVIDFIESHTSLTPRDKNIDYRFDDINEIMAQRIIQSAND